MDTSTIWGQAPAWISRTRDWFSERARMRRDAQAVSHMDSSELRDLGFSHTAAVESGIMMTECGAVARSNWIRAQPRFPRRVIRQD